MQAQANKTLEIILIIPLHRVMMMHEQAQEVLGN
jgi:hypothetical protein